MTRLRTYNRGKEIDKIIIVFKLVILRLYDTSGILISHLNINGYWSNQVKRFSSDDRGLVEKTY